MRPFVAQTGTLAGNYMYNSFGHNTNSSGSLTNFWQYTNRVFDAETNLYFYRARYYDPTIGKFLSEDPAGFPAGLDFYAYVKNNPVNWRDPDGRWPDPGSLARAWSHAMGAANWIQCSITASYCLAGLQAMVNSLGKMANFSGQPSQTYDQMFNTVDATHQATASNLYLNQACAANPNCMVAFSSCLGAAVTNPIPFPVPIPSTWPKK
jgi:RHS repeat-associated protein